MHPISKLMNILTLWERLFQPYLPRKDLLKMFCVGAETCPGDRRSVYCPPPHRPSPDGSGQFCLECCALTPVSGSEPLPWLIADGEHFRHLNGSGEVSPCQVDSPALLRLQPALLQGVISGPLTHSCCVGELLHLRYRSTCWHK